MRVGVYTSRADNRDGRRSPNSRLIIQPVGVVISRWLSVHADQFTRHADDSRAANLLALSPVLKHDARASWLPRRARDTQRAVRNVAPTSAPSMIQFPALQCGDRRRVARFVRRQMSPLSLFAYAIISDAEDTDWWMRCGDASFRQITLVTCSVLMRAFDAEDTCHLARSSARSAALARPDRRKTSIHCRPPACISQWPSG